MVRLSEIYTLIRELKMKTYQIEYVNSTNLGNLQKFKELLRYLELNNFDFFKNEIQILKESEIYSTTQNNLDIFNKTAFSEVYRTGTFISDSIKSLQIILERIVPTSTETYFLIKFPKPSDFQMLLKDMGEIQKHISIIVNDDSVNSSAEIHNWEYGSYWINLTLGSMLAVKLLGDITWSSAYISTQINKQKEQELLLREMEARVEMIEELKETQSKYLNKLIDNEITHISKEHFSDENRERDKKIKNTIKLFSEIIQRGGEFQPSLISPQEIKDSYPDFNTIEFIESKVKQITHIPESKR